MKPWIASRICWSACLCTTAVWADTDQFAGALGKAGNGPSDSPIEEPRSLVEVRASSESSKVTLRFGGTISSAAPDVKPGESKSSPFTTWSVTAEAPVTKGKDTTDLATLDGLGNATTVEFKFNTFRTVRRYPDDDRTDAICDLLNKTVEEKARAVKELLEHANPENLCDAPQPPASAGQQPANCAAGKPKDEPVCDTANINKHLPEEVQREWRSLFWDDSKARLLWGGSIKAGHETFEMFAETTGATKEKKTESPWSIEGHFGWLLPKTGLLTVGAIRESSFKAQDPVTRCSPIEDSDDLECVSSAPGDPTRKTSTKAFAEWRQRVAKMAYSVRVSRDFKDKVTGVDVPFYMWANKDGKLTGGIRAGWRDDTDDVVIGVFVGTAFKIFD
jgi:hypothetical protein